MRLLQVCNVGTAVGATGGCVAAVCRALPNVRHAVRVFGHVHADFPAALGTQDVAPVSTLSPTLCERYDAVLMHNTPPHRVSGRPRCPTVQYVHSDGSRIAADVTVACSHWLAARRGRGEAVLWQSVPATPPPRPDTRSLRDGLLIGRLCTPAPAKWPPELADFYAALSASQKSLQFEFVGCPTSLQSSLHKACGGRASFLPAGPAARQHLARWDVLLYANRRLPETFGRTVAEAMRAGCVPLVDDLGGFREQLDAGGGVLCRTVGDFARALTRLHDAGLRRRMALRAMMVADERFSEAAFRGRLKSLLAKIGVEGRA